MMLEATTAIPYGNACDVSIAENARMTTVEFAPDPHGGPEVMWFCLRVRRGPGGRRVPRNLKLVLRNAGNMLGAGKARNIHPVLRGAGGDWTRMEAGKPRTLPDGRMNVSWRLRVPDQSVDIALCYPYGQDEVESLVSQTGEFYESHKIGASQEARPIVRLSNTSGSKRDRRAGLYLLARQHSGETPGSWVLDGFLRHIAAERRKEPLVWAVPLADIDGVEKGDYGKDNFPYDLNRAWGSPPMRHEVLVLQRDIARWRERCRPVLAIDFHAPGLCEQDGMYAFLPKPESSAEAFDKATVWAQLLSRELGKEFSAGEFARIATYASRWETPGFSVFCASLGVCALSIETPYAISADGGLLTRDRYREAGARLALGVLKQLQTSRSNR